MEQEHIYTLDDVLDLGFEASCVGADGTRYLWHGTCGLRLSPGSNTTVLISDPTGLPAAPWLATMWGKDEIVETRILNHGGPTRRSALNRG